MGLQYDCIHVIFTSLIFIEMHFFSPPCLNFSILWFNNILSGNVEVIHKSEVTPLYGTHFMKEERLRNQPFAKYYKESPRWCVVPPEGQQWTTGITALGVLCLASSGQQKVLGLWPWCTKLPENVSIHWLFYNYWTMDHGHPSDNRCLLFSKSKHVYF